MPHIDYFMFTLSPFTYLAGSRLDEIAQKHGCRVTYKPFALMKVFEQTGGTPPAQRHESRKTYRLQELARVAQKTGMPINLQPAHWPTNPAPSCYAIIAAQAAGGGDLSGLTRSILRACWAEEKDIAQDDIVQACLADNGFDPELANSGLLSGAQVFEANTEEAVQRGVFGAPTYLVDDQVFWGQDRLDYLDEYLSGRD